MSRHTIDWPRLALAVDEVRAHHGLSERALAAQLGFSFSTISRLRNGHQVSADAVAALVAWLYPHQIPAWIRKIPCSTCGDCLAPGVLCTECECIG